MEGCLACDLTEGRLDLPGGRIHATFCERARGVLEARG